VTNRIGILESDTCHITSFSLQHVPKCPPPSRTQAADVDTTRQQPVQ